MKFQYVNLYDVTDMNKWRYIKNIGKYKTEKQAANAAIDITAALSKKEMSNYWAAMSKTPEDTKDAGAIEKQPYLYLMDTR